jgi:hypothetical protein
MPIKVHGHLHIEDDLGNTLVDKDNAIHPQNMARVIARALANESNYFIKRIAFGNGGTVVDAALNVTFNTPNDGQAPDTRTWDSQLYNETYSEIVDDSDPAIGSGDGASPGSDPATVEHVSGPGVLSTELGILSQVVVTAFLNPDEPTGQIASSTDPENQNLDGTFTFDEIGLFTDGLPQSATAGIHEVEVGTPATVNSETDTQLANSTQYSFEITVDGGTPTTISFTTPGAGTITYGDFCEAINTGDVTWNAAWGSVNPLPGGATVAITDISGNYPTIAGAQTFGYLRFTSGSAGSTSTVLLESGGTNNPLIGTDLFSTSGFNNPTGPTLLTPVDGSDAGVQNDPVNPGTEAERLLTHVIFSPVQKTADRTLSITYTLTIAVARSQ